MILSLIHILNNKIVSKEQLVDVALGALPADIVIKGGNLVNVLTREIYKADIVIFGNRVAATGACDYQVSPDTKIIDASGKWIAPGFMDPHMHLESTAITVDVYKRQSRYGSVLHETIP